MVTTRPEKKEDFDAIRHLVKTAFETAKVADGDEHEYVDRLRRSDRYIPELALVAEKGGVIVGHIMLTRLPVSTSQGIKEELLLSPLCVAFEHRGKGCGGLLIEKAVSLAKTRGFGAVFLAGDPTYYRRYGFESIAEHGIHANSDIPAQYLLVREIRPGALTSLKDGNVDIH